MAKFDINKATGVNNLLNAVQQVKNINNIMPLTEAKELLVESIFPSVENFYSVEELDELSDSIKELGILQPLLVSENGNGAYEIIAGNRRYEAAKMAGLERLPCIVKQNVEPTMFKIMLIHANMFRVKTDIERAREVSELKKAIMELKSSDKSIKGRTNEIAGHILNLSDRQVGRLDNLNKLIPEIQRLVQNDKLTSSCAEQFANLEDGAQKEIYEALIDSGINIGRNEAVKLRNEFLAKSREIEEQNEAGISVLREKLKQKDNELKEKIIQTEALLSKQKELEQVNEAKINTGDRKELEKIKQALVTALKERKEIEDRYNELSRMNAESVKSEPYINTDKLVSDVKRKANLAECVNLLKQASRIYREYRRLYEAVLPVTVSGEESALLSELTENLSELFRIVK